MKYLIIIIVVSLSISLILANPVPNQEGVSEIVQKTRESTTRYPNESEEETQLESDEKGSTEKEDDKVKKEDDEDSGEDEHKHPFGKPLNVVKFDKNENFIIDDEALNRTFLHPEVKDRKIVAVSIIGAFRKGKSFLMDYALRYMYANYKSVSNPNNTLENKTNWIGDPEAPLQGFSWRGGASRDTTGVVLWSDVFLHEQKDPKTNKIEKLAIVLMDTQGLFDSNTSPTDNSRIFALGTLISSLQIFNLNDVIQENQLEYLQMATDFAKFAIAKRKDGDKNAKSYKPFQTLIFLMRDWQNNEEYEYGHLGGSQYIAQTLNIKPTQPKPLQEVRQYITESFEQRLCFLLPHPGFKAVNNKEYDGRFSELNEEFQTQLKDFLRWLLSQNNLKKKKILDNEVNGAEYLEYATIYFKAFQSNEIPEIETLHGITVRKQYDIIMQESFDEYKKHFKSIEMKIGEQWKETSILEQEMKNNHKDALKKAIIILRSKKKLGNKNDEKKFEEELKKQIQLFFIELKDKQLQSYEKFKEIEIQKQKELDELNKQKDEKLRIMQEEEEKRRFEMAEAHKNKTEQLEGTIANVKNQTAQEMEKLKIDLEENKAKAEKRQRELQLQFEEERRRIQQETKEKEKRFQEDLNNLNNDIQRREEEAKRLIVDKQAERLKILEAEAELKMIEFENQMKIAEKQEEALKAQREYDTLRRMEENRIRADMAKAEKEHRDRAEDERRRTDQLFQQKWMEFREQTLREEQAAQRRRDEELRQLMWWATSTTRRTTTYVPPKKQMTNLQAFGCGFTLGIACLFY